MYRSASTLLAALGVNPRPFFALTKALILMDLRGQHYAQATATKERHVVSPLFWVVGQCLTLSAVTSLVLFMRVDVFFYAFVGLATSMLVIAAAVLVEFNEVVLDPRDLEIIAHRPITPRTYAAARLANLLFYVALMACALNIFPLVVGAALPDAGPWYAPAYLLATLAGNLITVAVVIIALSAAGRSKMIEEWKQLLAWTQIVLILVAGYGAQFALRSKQHALEVWAAFPPAWIEWLPPTWLARYVEAAAVRDVEGAAPSGVAVGIWTAALAAMTLAALVLTVWRVSRMYRRMQPAVVAGRRRPMPSDYVGTLGRPAWQWFARGAAERIGFWMCSKALARDGHLRMRCLLPLNAVVAVVVLGLATDQFANPLTERDPGRVTLSLLACYLICLGVPSVLYNLSFSEDWQAGWLLVTAPVAQPGRIAIGMCKAVQWWIVTPLCLALGTVAAVAWGDPLAAALHAALAWGLSWLVALAFLCLTPPAFPLSLPYARAGSIGPIALPLAAFSAALMSLGTVHFLAAFSPYFWIITAVAMAAACSPLAKLADRRLAPLVGAQP